MSQEHLILIAVIELFILYLIVYSIKVVRKWANKKIDTFDEICADLPGSFSGFRKEMRNFNRNIRKRFIPQPLTVDEITSIFGEVFSFAIQSRLPLLSVNKKFAFLSLILKFWKIRHRIIATFAQKFLKSAY